MSILPPSPLCIFRCDASPLIGGGHVMRCLALADNLSQRGWICQFSCSEETIRTMPQLASRGYETIHPEHLAKTADLLIVDHYDLDIKFERECRSWAARIMIIDDLANRPHDCDVLLDMTYGRLSADYAHLTPSHCVKLVGPQYALLRPEFRAAREASLSNRVVNKGRLQRVFVFLSTSGFIPQAVEILKALASYNKTQLIIDAVVQAADSELENCFAESPHVLKIHKNIKNISTLMATADLAIGAGGITSWERCCLGLPSIIIQIADNQKMNAEQLGKCGAAINLGTFKEFSPDKLHGCLNLLVNSPETMIGMGDIAAQICDGNGLDYVLPWLYAGIPAKDGGLVSLRRMEKTDEDIIFAWQQDPIIRKHMRNPTPPTRTEHRNWMAKKLADNGCKPYIILYNKTPAGVVRLDRKADKISQESYEVSIFVNSALSGKNIASAALDLIGAMEPQSRLYAWVLKENLASQKLFMKAGYTPHKDGWYILDMRDKA